MHENKRVHRSLRLLRAEIILGNMEFMIPIMNLFWMNYIGMDQVQIALAQGAFMVIMVIMDVPMGLLADAFSRKWANVIGDLVLSIGFFGYAFAQSLWQVVAAEVVLAIGMSCTNGADGPLMEEYCDKLGKDYLYESARIQKWTPLVMALAMTFGGFLGFFSPRLVIALTAVPFFIGALLGVLLCEDRRVREPDAKHPLRDIRSVVSYCFHGHNELAATILARTVLGTSTHTLVWVTTPILLLAGVPVWLVGVGWAINNIGASLGALMASKWGIRLGTSQAFVFPMFALVASCTILGLFPNVATAMLFAVFGAIKGWGIAIMPARVQQLAPERMKSSVNSVSTTLSRIVYIPLVYVIGLAGKTVPSHALLLNAAIFTVLGVSVLPKLRRHT